MGLLLLLFFIIEGERRSEFWPFDIWLLEEDIEGLPLSMLEPVDEGADSLIITFVGGSLQAFILQM